MASAAVGFFLCPLVFVSFELAVEQTSADGVGDTMSCGLINITSLILSFIIDLSLTPLLTKESKLATGITFALLMAILVIALIFLIIGSVLYPKKERKFSATVMRTSQEDF